MKLEWSRIDKHLEGWIKLMPEIQEDIWHLNNLLAAGDVIKSFTYRKVQKSASETGSSVQARVKMTVTLEIESIQCDLQSSFVRINGINVAESEHLKLGQHHTIELQLNKTFELFKKYWDSIYTERLKIACGMIAYNDTCIFVDPAADADIAAIVLQQGLANLCLISNHMTITKSRIEVSVPKKRVGSSQHDKAVVRFFDAILDAIVRHIDFDKIKVVLMASPAFLKDECYDYIFGQAIKLEIRPLIENKVKFVLCHSNSGHKHAIKEILADPVVLSRISNTHALDEVKQLDRFFKMLEDDPDRAFYGLQHVKIANDNNAIEVLLITDELFRASDIKTRKLYVELVEKVKENNADVKIFSTLHVSGEQLAKITGVAAILRFPMPNIEEIEQEMQRTSLVASSEEKTA